MFKKIKEKTVTIAIAMLGIALGAIKILMFLNKRKSEKIDELEQNAEVIEKAHEADIERVRFEVKQKQKVKVVNDESDLDKLDKERNKLDDKDDKDNDWDSITR